jgi:hypothetical protein
MKFCYIICLFQFLFSISLQSNWATNFIDFNNFKLKVIFHKKINIKYINTALTILDKSMDSIKPFSNNISKGFIRQGDVICISTRMIYWFSASPKNKRVVRTGGGLIAGMWEINITKEDKISFERISKDGYVSNLLYPGSQPSIGYYGADVSGGYVGSRVFWGLEFSKFTQTSNKCGRDIIEYDNNLYSSDEGVFIEFTGLVGNSGVDSNIEDKIDTDPRPKVIGKTAYILTYRIPAYQKEFVQELVFKVILNEFGPINSVNVSLNLPGYDKNKMVYAADRELFGNRNLKNVSLNKYFKNSCSKVYFYDKFYKKTEKKEISNNILKIGCIGSPFIQKPFVCAYPGLEFLPKQAWNDNMLELIEDQSNTKRGRYHSINFKLIPSGKKTINLKKDQSFSVIMRYKVIPSFFIYDSSKTLLKE